MARFSIIVTNKTKRHNFFKKKMVPPADKTGPRARDSPRFREKSANLPFSANFVVSPLTRRTQGAFLIEP